MNLKKAETIDDYIAAFSGDARKKLKEMRSAVKEAAPLAEETISYAIPTFRLNGNLVHFAAFKNHIGFYPTPQGIEAFTKELAPYTIAKGSAQFPLDKPLPISLIKKIVKFRVKSNLERIKEKK